MDRYVLNVWKLVTQPGDSINFLDMKKSSAWLTSALNKTRPTVRLRLCVSENPERTWFLNNANAVMVGRLAS